MAVRHVELSRDFGSWPTRKAWIEWAERMGLDPKRVMIPGYIEADDDARTVSAHCNVVGPDGKPLIDQANGGWSARVHLVVQLESPALPMPEAY
jgi:hypothetical protein